MAPQGLDLHVPHQGPDHLGSQPISQKDPLPALSAYSRGWLAKRQPFHPRLPWLPGTQAPCLLTSPLMCRRAQDARRLCQGPSEVQTIQIHFQGLRLPGYRKIKKCQTGSQKLSCVKNIFCEQINTLYTHTHTHTHTFCIYVSVYLLKVWNLY